MSRLRYIFSIIVILLFVFNTGSGQTIAVQDTIKTRAIKGETTAQTQSRTANGNMNRQGAGPGSAGTAQGVKQVRGGRPDMSKAKGARPPVIVRPSGSGIPKGVGKPGGAMKRGGR